MTREEFLKIMIKKAYSYVEKTLIDPDNYEGTISDIVLDYMEGAEEAYELLNTINHD